MIIDGEKPPPGELQHHGIKGMKWGIRKDSRLRPSNWMVIPEGTPRAARIQRESDAHGKVVNATTVSAHKKALDNLAEVQRKNRIEAGKAKTADLVKRHGMTPVKTLAK